MRRQNTHYSWASDSRSHSYTPLEQYVSPSNFCLHYLYPGRPMEVVIDRKYIAHSNSDAACNAFDENKRITTLYAKWLQSKTLNDARTLGHSKGVEDKITLHPVVEPDFD